MSERSGVFVAGGTGYIGRLLVRLPGTRESARRIGLVTLPQMVAVLVRAVEKPPDGVRIVEVPEIRGQASAGRDDRPKVMNGGLTP